VVPESVAALYAFLAMVSPGLVFQMLRERARPALAESTFREISRIALTSLTFTTTSIIALLIVAKYQTSWFVDITEWLNFRNAYATENPFLVARTLLALVTLSCATAWLAHRFSEWVASRSHTRIVKTSVWYQLFIEDVPLGKTPWVGLKLTDGSYAWGFVDFFTVDKKFEDREISLRGPGLMTECSSAEEPKEEQYWQRLCYRADDISWVKVEYRDAVQRKKWWQRSSRLPAASRDSTEEPEASTAN
jgi:hypothetical protein